MRRVVVTGMGIVCPLGLGISKVWQKLVNGQSGIRKLDRFDVSDVPSRIAGQLPEGSLKEGAFDVNEWVTSKEKRKIDPFIIYAIAASRMAIEDAGWQVKTEEQSYRSGVIIGSGIGGLSYIENNVNILAQKGAKYVSPFYIPSALINLASGHISIENNLKGPVHSVVTACASGTHAIGDAARFIALGHADVMVSGGSEAPITPSSMAGFSAMRALSTNFNDRPESASRPWDKDRDGFVMAEGAGVLLLEEYEHAKKRNAKIYAEIVGYGLSGDANHITAPAQDGIGAYLSMKNALQNTNINLEDIGYINAHGTSTPVGDNIELNAIKRLFDQSDHKPAISSTKSAIGHLLGAAGAVEAIFCIQALREKIIPPTLNLHHPADEFSNMHLVAHHAQDLDFKFALSNSFGFGGTNASIILKRF
ncbi:MAG: beta-ketoacyl-ACP synthase II [Pseudomonadota bacterium]